MICLYYLLFSFSIVFFPYAKRMKTAEPPEAIQIFSIP